MKIRKFLAAVLVMVLVVAAVPVFSLAENIQGVVNEAYKMNLLDITWADLDAVEANAIASGMSRTEVIKAVQTAALNNENVDSDSFSDFTKDGFFFTVDGMYCCYNYRMRNELNVIEGEEDHSDDYEFIPGTGEALRDCAGSPNVLLVGPYYGYDSSFTDQYKNEAQSIANATGGSLTKLESTAATGPAIAQNYTDKGVVIYDSHGNQIGSTSYLDLRSSTGLTSTDYSNGWAYNGSSFYGIDGRYIQNHASGTLSCPIVWMAICQGMKREGQGTTGTALLAAGAGCVYGYSQSVSFTGDYQYETTFWNEMKDGAMVKDAIAVMKATHGNWDPAYSSSSGAAWPIVMSPLDPFPSNPDGTQTVNCEWTLFSQDPVELESFSLSTNNVEIYFGKTANVTFNKVPNNANQYSLVWSSANTSIASVSGNNGSATITGTGIGSTTVTCTVLNANNQTIGTATVAVSVVEDTSLKDALNVEGGTLSFATSDNYPWEAVQEGNRNYAKSTNGGNHSTTSSVTTIINAAANDTLSFDFKAFGEGSSTHWDKCMFIVNNTTVVDWGAYDNSSWETYTYTFTAAGTYTVTWTYSKDSSVNPTGDYFAIDNVAWSGDPGEQPAITADGDLDGNGVVEAVDALTALRYALGSGTPTAEELARADMDGNGTIDATDALMILRLALNQ